MRLAGHAQLHRSVPSGPTSTIRRGALGRIIAGIRSRDVRAIVIAGPAGAGKTWLAQAALMAVGDDRTLIGQGKFSESDAQAALGPVISALSLLVEGALARFYDAQTGIASLTETLGVDLEVLISAGLAAPGLSERSSLRALANRRRGITRISVAVLNLLRWTEKFEVPRALLIDDWWRAPPEAIELIDGIAGMIVTQPLTLLLTQREPAGAGATVAGRRALSVVLGALGDDEIATLLAEQLGTVESAELVLAALGSAVPRLPFDIVQAAEALRRSGALYSYRGQWQIDSAKVGGLAFDAEDRIQALPIPSRTLAAALALWGDSAPLDALAQSLDGDVRAPPLCDALDDLQKQGIVACDGVMVTFRHDRLREAALNRRSPVALESLAGAMAEQLTPNPASSAIETAALHLRLIAGLTDADAQKWRDRFAHGATAARGRGDVDAAGRFAEAALALRGDRPADDRDADRIILREAVLAAADRDDPTTEGRAEALIASARSPLEQYEDYETGIVALRLAEQNDAAWRLACKGLRVVGITPPSSRPLPAFIGSALRWWLRQHTDRLGVRSPDMTMDAFTGVAAFAATIAYHRNPAAAAVIGFRGSIAAGRASRRSPYWQSVDGFLFAALGAYGRAAAAGERAVANFAEQRVLRAATLYQALFFGVHWRQPLSSQRDRFREVTRIALTEGDLITASYGLRIFIMSGWRTTASLDALREEAEAARNELVNIGEASFVDEMNSMVALLEGLTGRTAWDPAVWRDDIPTRNHVIDLELSNMAGDWPETVRRADLLRPLRRDYNIQSDSVALRFHETLARLRCGLRPRVGDLRFLRRAATLNPGDHRSKLLLIEAERLRRRPKLIPRTLVAYAVAMEAAMRADSRLDAALAATCAAGFATSIGDHGLARTYRERADSIYTGWGARAKTSAGPVADPEELTDARARADSAERADQAKSRLLSHVGHELRTPLQALRALLDLGFETGRPVDMEHIRAVLGSLTSVVDDLNIVDGFGEQRPSGLLNGVDLADVLRSEITVWQDKATVSFLQRQPSIPIDLVANRVRQIVRNLLSNAVKYGAGSPIAVELGMMGLDGNDVAITVTVQDGGPGLGGDQIEGVFEPYDRGTFDGDGRGMGLGLALSRRIAERLGGSLEAENALSGGARFTLRFIAQRSIAISCETAVDARILLVEDSPLIRPLFVTLLTRAGHQVVEAADAAQAITAWRDHAFDILVMDIGLPDASGLDVLAQIRAAESGQPPLPVILLTASTASAAQAAAIGDPDVRVLRKPVSVDELNAAIAALTAGEARPAAAEPVGATGLEPFYQAAEIAIREQARLCLTSVPDAAWLHQLAGLSAQFGWNDITKAVEELSEAIRNGAPLNGPRMAIAAALMAMA